MHDLFAIDNALVDILVKAGEQDLENLQLRKGICNFPDDGQREHIHTWLSTQTPVVSPGGSAANMAVLFAQLGGKAVFCDAVGNDEFGDLYERDLVANGVVPRLGRTDDATGTACTFITSDAQRTFAVHLGASLGLSNEHLPVKDIQESRILYITAYVLEDPSLQSTVLHAVETAKKAGRRIALDLSDTAIVERNHVHLKRIIEEHVDILFANEPEAIAFTGKPAEDALLELGSLVELAIVKIGERGSLLKSGNAILKIPAHVVTAVDTTGAGDAYAAGLLYGLTHGSHLSAAADAGSLLAARVISQVGARLKEPPVAEVRELLLRPLL